MADRRQHWFDGSNGLADGIGSIAAFRPASSAWRGLVRRIVRAWDLGLDVEIHANDEPASALEAAFAFRGLKMEEMP